MKFPRTFIPSSQPVLASVPPTGKGWLHEVKFDGYRAQIQKSGAKQGLTAWCFDLLAYDDRDVLRQPIEARRDILKWLLRKTDDEHLRFSEAFDDPIALFEEAVRLGLDGIVSKRKGEPYHSGKNYGWVKVKTHDWREANKARGDLFSRR